MPHEQSQGPRPEPEPTYQTGDRLGKFVIRKFIAHGGMGELYRAWDPDLNRPVAIKTLLPTASLAKIDALFVRRLREEAKAIAGIQHENIVQILHFGETEDRHQPYIVMPFLDGEDLTARLRRAQRSQKPLGFEEAVDIIHGAVGGVETCHQAGLVHRDLTPSNIFLARDQASGRLVVKVLDFGVARPARRDDAEITLDGFIVGSLQYMAPEQARGEPADAQSDQYALGGILYALLTLHAPYDHVGRAAPREKASSALLRAVRAGAKIPPISEANPNVPSPLVAIIMRALSHDPQHRYRSVFEFGKALLPYGSAESRNYISPYYRAPPMPIVLPQFSAALVAPPDSTTWKTTAPPRSPSAKLTIPIRTVDATPTTVEPPDFVLLLTTKSPNLDDIVSTEVRPPSASALIALPDSGAETTKSPSLDNVAPTEVRPPSASALIALPDSAESAPVASASEPVGMTSLDRMTPRLPLKGARSRTSRLSLKDRPFVFIGLTAGVATMMAFAAAVYMRWRPPPATPRPPLFLMSPPAVQPSASVPTPAASPTSPPPVVVEPPAGASPATVKTLAPSPASADKPAPPPRHHRKRSNTTMQYVDGFPLLH